MLCNDISRAIDPALFSEYIGLVPDPWQAEVLRYEGKRLLLNCSRQSGKSTTTATKALHEAIYKPRSLILLVSPSLRQSQELYRKVTDGLDAMENRPPMLEFNRLSMILENRSRIISLPSNQATVRGFSGVNLILEDESAQCEDTFFKAILPMLIVNNGALISMSTPYGKRGHFHEAWTEGGDDWHRIEIPASKCPRISPEELERQRRSLGALFFRQEFNCEFLATADSVFDADMVRGAFSDDIEPLYFGGEA